MFRNRKLLDAAHECHRCMNCGRIVPDGCDPAHSNELEHGKGVGLKAHDVFFAALCQFCHRWYDNQLGPGKDPSGRFDPTREGKRDMFMRAKDRTLLWLAQLGKLVAA